MPRVEELPRRRVYVDVRGRVVIPEYMRRALGIVVDGWVDLELVPSMVDARAIMVKKR